MPKDAFFRLSEKKKNTVYEICKKEFEDNPFREAKVSHIVSELKIARGSFYQYFEDLMDCYFYVLSNETVEIHELFFELSKENTLTDSLEKYGKILVKNLLKSENMKLYKNRYLYWDYELDKNWHKFKEDTVKKESYDILSDDLMHFLKSVVHDLIYRLYSEDWSEEEFLFHYDNIVLYLKNGLSNIDMEE